MALPEQLPVQESVTKTEPLSWRQRLLASAVAGVLGVGGVIGYHALTEGDPCATTIPIDSSGSSGIHLPDNKMIFGQAMHQNGELRLGVGNDMVYPSHYVKKLNPTQIDHNPEVSFELDTHTTLILKVGQNNVTASCRIS